MSENLQIIIDLVPSLNNDEVKKLQGLLQIKQGKCAKEKDKEPEVHHIPESFLFYSCIQKQFNYILKTRLPPIKMLNEKDRRLINKVCLFLINDLDEILISDTIKLNKGDFKKLQSAFFNLYVVTIINGISKSTQTVPVNLRTVLNWNQRFAGLLDNAYPGYAQNGQLITLVLLQQELK